MRPISKIKASYAVFIAALIAAIAYNSWPLGYALNPAITRSGGLASELEALNQPYNWLFVSLDVLCGLCVMVIVIVLWRKAQTLTSKYAMTGFGLFGLLTIADALLPMTCEPSLSVCPTLSHQPVLILHGIASIGSGVLLFMSAVLVWCAVRQRSHKILMSAIMAGWGISGLLTLYFFFTPGPGYLAQDYYLLLCGVWIVLFPIMWCRLATSPARMIR